MDRQDVVFLFDVDKMLLDNDRVTADWRKPWNAKSAGSDKSDTG